MESSCFCGVAFVGDDLDSLVAAGFEHYSAVHPELKLTPIQVRNYLEAEQRIDGPVDRLEEIGAIDVKPIGPATRDDIVEFFDRRAFADNAAWGMCYCMYHHIGGGPDGEWPKREWEENRSDLAARIDAGLTTGVVAYVDGVLAGFCNATARSAYPFKSSGSDEGIGSIVCFVVAPPYRGHGVQRAMLAGAIEELTERGFKTAEAYPIKTVENSASAFVGTLGLFEKQGFEIVSDEPLKVQLAL